MHSSSQSVSNIPTELREHLASPKAYVKVKVSIKNSILLHSKQVGFGFVLNNGIYSVAFMEQNCPSLSYAWVVKCLLSSQLHNWVMIMA